MIPKIIHFCWMSGDKYPDNIAKCLDTWKEALPDYEIKQWNKDNVDVNCCTWVKQAYDEKKYAFVADYVRFDALYRYGGIYLDSDVEVLKSFNSFLEQKYFFGYEYTAVPEAAVLGAEKGLGWIKKCRDWYENNNFINEDGRMQTIIAPLILKYGFESTYDYCLVDRNRVEKIDDGSIYPYDYFSCKNSYTGRIQLTSNSVSIHHFNSAWLKKGISLKIRRSVHVLMITFLGKIRWNKLMYISRKKMGKY